MVALRHPLTGTLYEQLPNNQVRVVHEAETEASVGIFDRDGRWLSGSLRVADAQMCRWVAEGRSLRSGAPGSSARAAAVGQEP